MSSKCSLIWFKDKAASDLVFPSSIDAEGAKVVIWLEDSGVEDEIVSLSLDELVGFCVGEHSPE